MTRASAYSRVNIMSAAIICRFQYTAGRRFSLHYAGMYVDIIYRRAGRPPSSDGFISDESMLDMTILEASRILRAISLSTFATARRCAMISSGRHFRELRCATQPVASATLTRRRCSLIDVSRCIAFIYYDGDDATARADGRVSLVSEALYWLTSTTRLRIRHFTTYHGQDDTGLPSSAIFTFPRRGYARAHARYAINISADML